MTNTRTESDFLGPVEIPSAVYWGVQTARARENFPVSGIKAHSEFIRAMARIKKAAAEVNASAGALPEELARPIVQAAEEVIDGRHDAQFVVDVYQAGAGTSFHMNMNEVLANRAIELLGGARGDYDRVHPNDHVNLGQSTNDVFPTAMRLAALEMLPRIDAALADLEEALSSKADAFRDIVRSGRTHLQDAAPMTLGQVFTGYARAVARSREGLIREGDTLRELGIGGSAVGTGITSFAGYRQKVVARLSELTGEALRPSESTFEAMQSNQPFALVSGALRALSLELIRIANDLRLLASGPRTGLGDITLPAVQPGSSIMPGKVNPVMAEMLDMVAMQVVGFDATIAVAVQAGQMELNVMMPVINYNLLQGLRILTNALNVFTDKCVRGIEADPVRCRKHAMASVGLATVLKPIVGYAGASEVAKESARTGRPIGELAIERGLLTKDDLAKKLTPEALDPDGGKGGKG